MAIISLPTIYSNAWAAATNAQAAAQSAATSAQGSLSAVGSVAAPTATLSGAAPGGEAATAISQLGNAASEANTLFASTQQSVTAQLQSLFEQFLSTHFPPSQTFIKAKAWIESQLTDGGAGIRPLIEQRLWERDRDRIGAAAEQAQGEVITAWAARRFPIPPGAAVHQAAMIQREALGKMGDSSREKAVQAFLAELENTRFAITQAISLQLASVQSAGEYIRSLALGPQIGVQLAGMVEDTRAKAAQAAVAYYSAQLSLRDVDSRIAISNAGMALDANKTVFGATTQMALAKANVAIEAARMTGTMAAAALNTFHGNVGYQESNDLTGTLLI